MQRSRVDLPAPDGPMMQTTSPFCTDSETSVSTSMRPKDFQIPSRRTIGSANPPAEADASRASPPMPRLHEDTPDLAVRPQIYASGMPDIQRRLARLFGSLPSGRGPATGSGGEENRQTVS